MLLVMEILNSETGNTEPVFVCERSKDHKDRKGPSHGGRSAYASALQGSGEASSTCEGSDLRLLVFAPSFLALRASMNPPDVSRVDCREFFLVLTTLVGINSDRIDQVPSSQRRETGEQSSTWSSVWPQKFTSPRAGIHHSLGRCLLAVHTSWGVSER